MAMKQPKVLQHHIKSGNNEQHKQCCSREAEGGQADSQWYDYLGLHAGLQQQR